MINTFVTEGGTDFSGQPIKRDPLVGIHSMILFLVSFGIGYRQKSRFTISLILVGGIVELAFKPISAAIDLLLVLSIGQTETFVHLLVCDKLCYNGIRID